MTEETNKNASLGHYIWEGAVGCRLAPQKRQDGTYFWKYSLTRAFKREGSEDFEYATDFTDRNSDAIITVLGKAQQFQAETDATKWVESKLAA